MKRFWRLYGLAVVLAVLFLASWALQTYFGWVHYAAEQQAHGETATWFGQSGYIHEWGEATFENWQSEFLQLLTFVVMTTYLMYKGSPESRWSDIETKEHLNRIERKLNDLLRTPQDPTLVDRNDRTREAS